MELKPGYKQTEVGAIPEDWELTTVGDAFEIHNTLRFPISNAVRETMPGPYPYYGPTSIQGYINEYRVEGEYALIGVDGDHFLKWQTQPMTLLVQGKFNVNNHAHLVRGTKNLTSWFYYYFSRRDLTPYLTRQGASRYKLTKKKLAALPCAIPAAVAEQTAVAEALSDADALIESLDQLIAKKRQIKQGAMQELLTGKRRLPGFSGEWEVKTIRSLVQTPVTDGPHMTPQFLETGIPFLSVNNLVDNRIDMRDLRYISQKDHEEFSKKCKPRKGDLLLGKAASVGKVAIVDTDVEFNIWSPIALIRPSSESVSRFIYYQLQTASLGRQIALLTNSSSQGNIGMGDIEKLELLIPPQSEQAAIATIFSDMDAELAALEARCTKTHALKQGMMQALLTGRIRLI